MKTTQNLIQDVLATKVTAGETFSAFEVSREVQKLQKLEMLPIERHGQMRDAIHDEMKQYVGSSYGRKLVSYGGPVPAFQYSPNAPTQAAPQTASSVSATAVATADDDDEVTNRTPDARGTLTVPAHLMRAVGCEAGKLATVIAGKDSANGDAVLFVRNGGEPDQTLAADEKFLSEYTVDASDNVRITSLNLYNGGIGNSGGSLYKFEVVDGESVVVRKQ